MVDKITPQDLVTFLWVASALVAFSLALWNLAEKLKKSNGWRGNVEMKLNTDKERIEALEAGQKAVCRGVLALLSHEINGNSIDKLREASAEITDYLIER